MPQVADPKAKRRTRLAPQYKVLLHDDDITPMDFVVAVLTRFFQLGLADATRIMVEAHNTGVALVAVMPLELAELRVEQVQSVARTCKYPLTLSIEAA